MKEAATLNGTQKAAALLMQLSQGSAAAVMGHLNDAEAEAIAAEIVRMRRVHPDIAEAVITEFHDLVVSGRHPSLGGREFAAGLLEASFGSEKAAGVMDRLTSSPGGNPFEFLDQVQAPALISLLDGELAQTVALVLAHLRSEQASAVLAGLPPASRAEVAQAIAGLGPATPEALKLVAATLKQRVSAAVVPREKSAPRGGVLPLVEILNRSDPATERALLADLDVRDPALAQEVRSHLLTFADLARLDDKAVQVVLRGIEPTVLAKALKGAAQPLLEAVQHNISERNRELLESEMEVLGAIRGSDVEQARADVARHLRNLVAAGAVSVHDAEEDQIVS